MSKEWGVHITVHGCQYTPLVGLPFNLTIYIFPHLHPITLTQNREVACSSAKLVSANRITLRNNLEDNITYKSPTN
jgi:hypothetical protein